MKIQGKTALVTGANRGLGLAYAKALLAAGAAKVYAGARDPSTVTQPGVVPVKLDVTSLDDVTKAAAQLSDVDIVINNAGIALMGTNLLEDGGEKDLRAQLDTNVWGILNVSRAFAPVLRANGGGALVNMLSVLSWLSRPHSATYSISKAAAWALTNGLRNDMRDQGTLVIGVHAGLIDTDMAKELTGPKTSADDIALRVIEGLQNGDEEVLADAVSQKVKAGFAVSPSPYLLDQRG
ncbi:SDR family oxidoreductase [Dyella sp.]|jgi:NAD(P)-dependent dehydrogenase (short-subunit alcohol dehydrogenase family)|uniref:SDR family oxidoreductase n=1 Tax=Dyella sp. TaxID=1869338 RepID=UPI002BDB85FB|nr:SDR family oxidoreductase [Dyella sp.]HTC25821.1 SDR family oxidoreductase [Dyella sp.]